MWYRWWLWCWVGIDVVMNVFGVDLDRKRYIWQKGSRLDIAIITSIQWSKYAIWQTGGCYTDRIPKRRFCQAVMNAGGSIELPSINKRSSIDFYLIFLVYFTNFCSCFDFGEAPYLFVSFWTEWIGDAITFIQQVLDSHQGISFYEDCSRKAQ